MSALRFSGRLEPKFNPFQEDYLAEILKAAALAWARMRPPSRGEIEDRITFRLAGRLANDPYFSEIPYDVVPQYWLLGLNGQRLGRLDLRFKHRYSQRDYFAFESKRLHISYPGGNLSTEYPTYAGDDGMMAFVVGQYCKALPAAGMLGYIMDAKSDKAWTGLEKRIDVRRKPLKLAKKCTFPKSALSEAVRDGMQGTHLGETKHDLKTHSLRLFHLLLPVGPTVM
jgi:hypothetical protein